MVLFIERYSITDAHQCEEFCSIEEFFELLMGWPDIESVLFHYEAIRSHFSEPIDAEHKALEARILNPPAGCCPRLRSLELDWCTLPRHIRALQRIAPSIEKFVAGVFLYDHSGMSIIEAALSTWASTLGELSLRPWGDDDLAVVMSAELCTRLTRLHTLDGSTALMDVRSLCCLKQLENLTFAVTQTSHVEVLNDILQKLPSLKHLHLYANHDETEGLEQLEHSAKQYGIQMQLNRV